jgi:hypothetical protein
MEIKKASKQEAKLRIGLSGASGFGKTYSALLLAYGMTGDWSKICVIDTENNSASLYSNLGNYNVIDLQAPYNPEKFIDALKLAENSGMTTLVLDSITSEWQGSGGCLEIHEQLGGRWQDWAKVTPRHQAFIDAILQSKCNVITCVRRKIEYSLDTDSNGRMKVTKLGTKEQTREGFEYELTVNFEIINENHLSKASKDRTGLFMNKPEFVINSSTGVKLISWARSTISKADLQQKIVECITIQELTQLYQNNLDMAKSLEHEFVNKKNLLNNLLTNISSNGNGTYPKAS